MSTNTISPDDPRLTAYALNEMGAVEREEFERALAHDPGARQAVEDIRAAAAAFETALEHEPELTGGAEEESSPKAAIIAGRDLRKLDGGPLKEPFKLIRFPQFYFAVSGLAAACFAIFFVYWRQQQPLHDKKQYREVTLMAAASAEGDQMADADNPGEMGAEEPERKPNAKGYGYRHDSLFLRATENPFSTFALAVDKASYANVRRFLAQGQRPPADAVRIEELVNYFPYRYARPSGGAPFAASLEVASAPWAPEHRLVRIGLQGREGSHHPGGTPAPIAKDVKIQVEFNPREVQAYRLLGYENRLLAEEAFNNDQVDAGEIGAGHTVTALYEVVPTGAVLPEAGSVDALKYSTTGAMAPPPSKERDEVVANPSMYRELLTVRIGYKEPADDVSGKLEFALRDAGARFEEASQDFRFAAAVAAFGMVLRDSPHRGTASLANVMGWGRAGVGEDAGGYRAEFIGLTERAQKLVQ